MHGGQMLPILQCPHGRKEVVRALPMFPQQKQEKVCEYPRNRTAEGNLHGEGIASKGNKKYIIIHIKYIL